MYLSVKFYRRSLNTYKSDVLQYLSYLNIKDLMLLLKGTPGYYILWRHSDVKLPENCRKKPYLYFRVNVRESRGDNGY